MPHPTTDQIREVLQFLQNAVHTTAVEKGWWKDHDQLKQAVSLYNELFCNI